MIVMSFRFFRNDNYRYPCKLLYAGEPLLNRFKCIPLSFESSCSRVVDSNRQDVVLIYRFFRFFGNGHFRDGREFGRKFKLIFR